MSTQHALTMHARAADLPPVAADAVAELMSALGEKTLGSSAGSVSDVAVARTALAEQLAKIASCLGPDLARRPCEAALLALAVATLAEAHRLDHDLLRPACRAARDVAADLLRRHGRQLRRRARQLLQSVVDGVATEEGRAAFITETRALLARARRWRPTCLDVSANMLKVGGMTVSYRTSRELENGDRSSWTVKLSTSNAEGRLLLMVADGRPPVSASAPVISRVNSALRKATNGVVQMYRDERGLPRCRPPLELAPRAKRLTQTVRSLHVQPRAPRKKPPKAASSSARTS